MSVVVTGSAGFIGRALVRRLRAAGHAVVAVDRAEQGTGEAEAPGITRLVADLLEGDPLVETVLRDDCARE